MRYVRSLLVLGISLLATAAATNYSDISSVSNFVKALDVDTEAGSQVAAALNSSDISSLNDTRKASLACQVSSIVFGVSFISSSAATYDALVDVNWSDTCWLDPQCIVQPGSAEDVSRAVLIVTFLGSRFAVRSGGHNPNVGFASIDGGVLVDLVNLNEVTLSSDGSLVSIGPGNRFKHVYNILESRNKTVVGARVSAVGVGGYLLGGGLPYFASSYGMASNNIRNYEIVLGNSSIVNANATSNSDLWWALKGGGANFGIVTRFDVETVDNSQIWFSALAWDGSQNEKILEAVVTYAAAAEDDSNAGLVMSLGASSSFLVFIYGKPVERPDIFDPFYDIPSNATYIASTIGSWVDLHTAVTALNLEDPARVMIMSATYKWDLPTLQENYATFVNTSTQVSEQFNGSFSFIPQVWTSQAVEAASAKGGNPLGMAAVSQNMLTATLVWHDSADDEAALKAIGDFRTSVQSTAKKNEVDLPFEYMNDASSAQDVLTSYGSDSLTKLKSISQSCDPLQVFQELQYNGFLLAKS